MGPISHRIHTTFQMFTTYLNRFTFHITLLMVEVTNESLGDWSGRNYLGILSILLREKQVLE